MKQKACEGALGPGYRSGCRPMGGIKNREAKKKANNVVSCAPVAAS